MTEKLRNIKKRYIILTATFIALIFWVISFIGSKQVKYEKIHLCYASCIGDGLILNLHVYQHFRDGDR